MVSLSAQDAQLERQAPSPRRSAPATRIRAVDAIVEAQTAVFPKGSG